MPPVTIMGHSIAHTKNNNKKQCRRRIRLLLNTPPELEMLEILQEEAILSGGHEALSQLPKTEEPL